MREDDQIANLESFHDLELQTFQQTFFQLLFPTTANPVLENWIYFKEPRIVGLDTDQGSATIQNAVIAGVIAAMLICIVGILFVVHRIKKKDEGSYKISASPS